jgi:hypothetical protein
MVFDFRLGRGRDGPQQCLGSFHGILQTDGYGAYDRVGDAGVVHAAFWAHSICKFKDAVKVNPADTAAITMVALLDRWEEHWADTRIHGRTKRQVAAMFAEENPSLHVLPLEPFRYYQYGKRTVHIDGCVEVDAAYYGAPPGWIGRQVDVQWDATFVRLLDPRTGVLLREHLGQKRGGHRIRDEDRPRRTPPHTHRLLARAHKAGPSIGTLCDAIHHRQAEAGVRRILGVLSLAKKYGCSAVDQACAAALELGVSEYRFVRRYLERGPQAPLTLRQVDPLIRELIQYRDLIQQRLNFEEPNP